MIYNDPLYFPDDCDSYWFKGWDNLQSDKAASYVIRLNITSDKLQFCSKILESGYTYKELEVLSENLRKEFDDLVQNSNDEWCRLNERKQ